MFAIQISQRETKSGNGHSNYPPWLISWSTGHLCVGLRWKRAQMGWWQIESRPNTVPRWSCNLSSRNSRLERDVKPVCRHWAPGFFIVSSNVWFFNCARVIEPYFVVSFVDGRLGDIIYYSISTVFAPKTNWAKYPRPVHVGKPVMRNEELLSLMENSSKVHLYQLNLGITHLDDNNRLRYNSSDAPCLVKLADSTLKNVHKGDQCHFHAQSVHLFESLYLREWCVVRDRPTSDCMTLSTTSWE